MRANELRELSIEWLKSAFPDSIIVPELSVADWGGASIDVAAITEDKIVGVEIKGEGDSPTRLDRQGITYGMAAKEMWLLCDESIQDKCFNRRPPGWGKLELFEGFVRPYNVATKAGKWIEVRKGQKRLEMLRDDDRYTPHKPGEQKHQCSYIMCGTLWRDELYNIAGRYKLKCGRSATVGPLTDAICEGLPVNIIHDEMIKQLRSRAWRKAVIDLRDAA